MDGRFSVQMPDTPIRGHRSLLTRENQENNLDAEKQIASERED